MIKFDYFYKFKRGHGIGLVGRRFGKEPARLSVLKRTL